MTSLSSIWTNFLQLITRRGSWKLAPRYLLNVSPVALKPTSYWERRRVRYCEMQVTRRSLRRPFTVMAILGLFAVPHGTASAEILYVTNFFDPFVTVVDTETDAVTTIPLQNSQGDPVFPRCIDFTSDGTRGYVSTFEGPDTSSTSDVVVIDTATQTVDDIFRSRPDGHSCVAVSPDGTKAYLTDTTSEIVVVSTADNMEIDTIDSIPQGQGNFQANRLLFSPNGSTLYVLGSFISNFAAQIEGIDSGPQQAKQIPPFLFTGRVDSLLLHDFALTPDGNRLYVAMEGNSGLRALVQVFDTDLSSSAILVNNVRVSDSAPDAGGIVITPDGQFAYVVVPGNDEVAVISTSDVENLSLPLPLPLFPREASIPVGGSLPIDIVLSSDGSLAYVTNFLSQDITIINTTDNTFVRTIPGPNPGSPFQIAILKSSTQPAPLDHFLCYKAWGRKVDVDVRLQDQFGPEEEVKVKRPKLFCNPVDKNGEGIFDPTAHLTGYEIKDRGDKVRRRVTLKNQFDEQEQTVMIEKPKLLLVPTQKLSVDGVLTTLQEPVALDHFKCYEVKGRDDDDDDDDDDHKKKRNKVNVRVDLLDQFATEEQRFKVKRPKLFCNPVAKTHDGLVAEIGDETAHLTCYEIKRQRHRRWRRWRRWRSARRDVTVLNQFSMGEKDLRVFESRTQTLCVPSTKIAFEVLVRDRDDDDDDDDHKKKRKKGDDDDD